MTGTRSEEIRMIDIRTDAPVEIHMEHSAGGRPTVWVNVDGVCRLRCSMDRWGQLELLGDINKPKIVDE